MGTLEQELKRSSEVVMDLERRLRIMEDDKAAFEKVCPLSVSFLVNRIVDHCVNLGLWQKSKTC